MRLAKDLTGHFIKDEMQVANKLMKIWPTLLVIGEMYIKTTNGKRPPTLHCLTRMAISKTTDNSKCCQGYGKSGTITHCCWESNMAQPPWKTVWKFFKKVNI